MKLIAKSKVTGDIDNDGARGVEKAPLQRWETTESLPALIANENHSY